MMNFFKISGRIDQERYLFMGDYVDRGNFGVEVMMVLLGIKINYPENIFLLRGNHETRHMTTSFNFF